ncbi:MAG: YraN family protein [Eubacteriales bacterium]|jgi:putative endonuclease|nr:YraN family protein [Eubacteriales bacterium]
MKNINLRTEGLRGENIACDYLCRIGYTIIKRNFRSKYGEIDIIAENDTHIIFVEVKSRSETISQMKYGRPAMAVNYKKREHILKSTKKYLQLYKPQKSPRIDIIEQLISPVTGTEFMQIKITHIKAAIEDD